MAKPRKALNRYSLRWLRRELRAHERFDAMMGREHDSTRVFRRLVAEKSFLEWVRKQGPAKALAVAVIEGDTAAARMLADMVLHGEWEG